MEQHVHATYARLAKIVHFSHIYFEEIKGSL
jgi:hypothetical protein